MYGKLHSHSFIGFTYASLHQRHPLLGSSKPRRSVSSATGQSIETGLSLLENFLLYKNERGLGMPDSVVLHTPFDVGEWVSGSNLPVQAVAEPCTELPWTAVGLAERRAILTVKQDTANHFQMIPHDIFRLYIYIYGNFHKWGYPY